MDFDTLERVSDGYISDNLRARADDIVWRVRCGGRQVYVLIEFQSRVDSSMAVRVLAQAMLSERFDEWEAQFRLEGRREGRKDGEVALLTLLLRKRFGELPEAFRARVAEARADELEHWGERLLEASSLDEVFGQAQATRHEVGA